MREGVKERVREIEGEGEREREMGEAYCPVIGSILPTNTTNGIIWTDRRWKSREKARFFFVFLNTCTYVIVNSLYIVVHQGAVQS